MNSNFDGNKEFYPGTSKQAKLTLDASPSKQVIITLSSKPTVTITPSTFTFNAGESPYSQVFTITSIEPGTYYIAQTLSGYDATNGFVNSAPSELTLVVDPSMSTILFLFSSFFFSLLFFYLILTSFFFIEDSYILQFPPLCTST